MYLSACFLCAFLYLNLWWGSSKKPPSVCSNHLCYRGNIQIEGNLCDRTVDDCPPCLAKEPGTTVPGCYEHVKDTCMFGSDCSDYPVTSSSSTAPNSTDSSSTTSSSTDSSTASLTNTSNAGDTIENSTSASVDETKDTRKEGAKNLPIFLGIAGGLIAAIAVGIGMYMLVKRSDDKEDDDDNMKSVLSPFFPPRGDFNSSSIINQSSISGRDPNAGKNTMPGGRVTLHNAGGLRQGAGMNATRGTSFNINGTTNLSLHHNSKEKDTAYAQISSTGKAFIEDQENGWKNKEASGQRNIPSYTNYPNKNNTNNNTKNITNFDGYPSADVDGTEIIDPTEGDSNLTSLTDIATLSEETMLRPNSVEL